MVWEPAMETWAFRICGSPNNLLITSNQVLNLNCTIACVSTIVKALLSFGSQFHSNSKSRDIPQSLTEEDCYADSVRRKAPAYAYAHTPDRVNLNAHSSKTLKHNSTRGAQIGAVRERRKASYFMYVPPYSQTKFVTFKCQLFNDK